MDVQFRFFLFAEFSHGIVYNVFSDVLRCVENTILFTLRLLLVKFNAFSLRIHAFNLIQRVLKDVPQDIYIHLAFKIVFGQNGSVLKEQFIVYFNSIKNRIRLKQPTIVGKNLMILSFPTFVQITEILFVTLIEWGIGIHFFE